MCLKCAKCGSFMDKDDDVYTCPKCLQELLEIKRKQWESQSDVTLEKESIDNE